MKEEGQKTRGTILSCNRSLIVVALSALLVLGAGACSPATTDRATTAATAGLRRAQAVLDAVARTPADAIPDAILNHTQCLLVFPSTGDSDKAGLHGTATCRRAAQDWESPGAVTLAGTQAAKGTDLLVFLLNTSAPKMLERANFELRSAAPGPLVRVTSVVAPVELRADAVAYAHAGVQLTGVTLSGRIRGEPAGKASETIRSNAGLIFQYDCADRHHHPSHGKHSSQR